MIRVVLFSFSSRWPTKSEEKDFWNNKGEFDFTVYSFIFSSQTIFIPFSWKVVDEEELYVLKVEFF